MLYDGIQLRTDVVAKSLIDMFGADLSQLQGQAYRDALSGLTIQFNHKLKNEPWCRELLAASHIGDVRLVYCCNIFILGVEAREIPLGDALKCQQYIANIPRKQRYDGDLDYSLKRIAEKMLNASSWTSAELFEVEYWQEKPDVSHHTQTMQPNQSSNQSNQSNQSIQSKSVE